MAKSYRTQSLPGIKACIDKMRKSKKSPLNKVGSGGAASRPAPSESTTYQWGKGMV